MEKIIALFIVIMMIAFFAIVFAIPTYFLWNWLMPILFGLKEITLAQAWGINVLSYILFRNNRPIVGEE